MGAVSGVWRDVKTATQALWVLGVDKATPHGNVLAKGVQELIGLYLRRNESNRRVRARELEGGASKTFQQPTLWSGRVRGGSSAGCRLDGGRVGSRRGTLACRLN